MSHRRYSEMSVEELMAEDRANAERQREDEEYRRNSYDVTRGEYEDLLARLEVLEKLNA